jgi:hypothetical protein
MDRTITEVVLEAHKRGGFSVSCDYARQNSAAVAMAASMGFISTRIHLDVYGREWKPSVKGLSLLNQAELEDDFQD